VLTGPVESPPKIDLAYRAAGPSSRSTARLIGSMPGSGAHELRCRFTLQPPMKPRLPSSLAARSPPTALAHRPFTSDAVDHRPEHRLLAGGEIHICVARLCRARNALGRHRSRYGRVAPCHLQRITPFELDESARNVTWIETSAPAALQSRTNIPPFVATLQPTPSWQPEPPVGRADQQREG
jgi:hypothetical protein